MVYDPDPRDFAGQNYVEPLTTAYAIPNMAWTVTSYSTCAAIIYSSSMAIEDIQYTGTDYYGSPYMNFVTIDEIEEEKKVCKKSKSIFSNEKTIKQKQEQEFSRLRNEQDRDKRRTKSKRFIVF